MWLPVTSTLRAYGTVHASHQTTPSPARVDRDERHRGGELAGEVLREAAAAGVGEAAVARHPVGRLDVHPAHRGDRGARGDRDVERRVEPGAERDHARDEVGAAVAERLGEVPAAAVADQRELPPGLARDPLRARLQRVERAVRAADVPGDARSGAARGPSGRSQPAITDIDESPARKPGISITGPPSPRGTPLPAKTGSIISRPSSACQRSSAPWRPHQRRGASGAAGGGGVGSKAWATPRVPTSCGGAAYDVTAQVAVVA